MLKELKWSGTIGLNINEQRSLVEQTLEQLEEIETLNNEERSN